MAWEIFLETFGVIEPKSYEKVKKYSYKRAHSLHHY